MTDSQMLKRLRDINALAKLLVEKTESLIEPVKKKTKPRTDLERVLEKRRLVRTRRR
jgi:hypothetical protein